MIPGDGNGNSRPFGIILHPFSHVPTKSLEIRELYIALGSGVFHDLIVSCVHVSAFVHNTGISMFKHQRHETEINDHAMSCFGPGYRKTAHSSLIRSSIDPEA